MQKAERQRPVVNTDLIEKAAAKLGTQAALCRHLGVPTSVMSNWKTGHTPCPAEYRALMYAVIGYPPDRAAAMGLIEANLHKPMGQKLAAMIGIGVEVVRRAKS
ncbi:MAG: hypothetical protein Q7U99_18405 [Rubrivivax sp.]|nr:hypothetical protein [Rubrivivax sp.]